MVWTNNKPLWEENTSKTALLKTLYYFQCSNRGIIVFNITGFSTENLLQVLFGILFGYVYIFCF